MNAAFTGEEQGKIALTYVDNRKSQVYWHTPGGNDTQDKIFLLSYVEAATWKNTSNMELRISPTAYAKRNGAYTYDGYKTADGANVCWWWLRSPGNYQYEASSVLTHGSLGSSIVSKVDVCVRPALWMNLES